MHVEKLTLSEARAIISHDLRKNKTYSNKNIDTSKREQNIVFTNNEYKYIKNRIAKDKIRVHGANGKAKDKINYAVSVILHYPEYCKIPETLFFKFANKIFEKKFGKDNVICSVVHRDEMRSHLHFVFMPVIEDKKHNCKKLCCKEIVNREMLKTLHSDIEKAFKDDFNIDVKLQNEEKGQFKNIKHIEDYKKLKDLEKEFNQLKEATEQMQIQKEELQIDNSILNEQVNFLKEEFTKLKKKFDDTTNDNEDLLSQIASLKKEINFLEAERKQKQAEAEEARHYYNDKKMTLEEVKQDINKNYNQAVESYRKLKNDEIEQCKKELNDKASTVLRDYRVNINQYVEERKNELLEKELERMGLTHELQFNNYSR